MGVDFKIFTPSANFKLPDRTSSSVLLLVDSSARVESSNLAGSLALVSLTIHLVDDLRRVQQIELFPACSCPSDPSLVVWSGDVYSLRVPREAENTGYFYIYGAIKQ